MFCLPGGVCFKAHRPQSLWLPPTFHVNLHIVHVHSLFNALKRRTGIDCTLHLLLVTLHTALKVSNTDSTVVESRG